MTPIRRARLARMARSREPVRRYVVRGVLIAIALLALSFALLALWVSSLPDGAFG